MKEIITLIDVSTMAESHGWNLIDNQQSIGMCSYSKTICGAKARINIYRSKMTVTTYIHHHKTGKNQLFRKKVSPELLDKIFKNPRIHTDKGYRRK